MPPAPTTVYVVGTRPNFMKAAPVFMAARGMSPDERHVLVHTGQHYDDDMYRVFLDQLGLPAPDHELDVGPGSHSGQTAAILTRLEEVLRAERPRLVVVFGDVNSTLAAGLAAAQLRIPVAHVEAGLRSFDRTMPEELNRVLTDQLSSLCFIHSPEARENLLNEGVPPERIFFVGNTMIDTLVRLRRGLDREAVLRGFGVHDRPFVLVTLHRPALVDGPLLLVALEELGQLAERYQVIFPVHPRTAAAIADMNGAAPGSVRLVPPIGYVECLALQEAATAVLTDSGGIQEETTFLGVPCFTLRESTERPITVTQGTNTVLGLRPERIAEIPSLLELQGEQRPPGPPEGWDGAAGERIAIELTGFGRDKMP
jgi:UDP-N-acetylglucosamine 2-epimerase (non-hydrolysing)